MLKIVSVDNRIEEQANDDQIVKVELTSSWDKLMVDDRGSDHLVEMGNGAIVVRERYTGRVVFTTAVDVVVGEIHVIA